MSIRTRAQGIILAIAAAGTALSLYWALHTFYDDPGFCRSVDFLNRQTPWHDCSWEEHFIAGIQGTKVEHAPDYLEGLTNFARGMLRTFAVIIGYGTCRWLKMRVRFGPVKEAS